MKNPSIILIESEYAIPITLPEILDQEANVFPKIEAKHAGSETPYIDFINDEIREKQPSLIFIDLNLTENLLEFTGIHLAYHLRLDPDPKIAGATIVFLGEESLWELVKTVPNLSIFSTKGVYLCPRRTETINNYLERFDQRKLSRGPDRSDFAKQIHFPRPSNHSTHHSTANEWSIVQWAMQLGMSDQEIRALPAYSNIHSELYYKYLSALNPALVPANDQDFLPQIVGKGRILLIDDEYKKGWKAIFEHLLQKHGNTKITLEVMEMKKNGEEKEFKTHSQNDIISACVKKIKKGKYDLVIIDLRLSDQDFESTIGNASSISGIKIIRRIKAWNKGQQVIAFTASNKIWNFSELKEAGVVDYIHKHSPEIDNAAAVIRKDIEKAIKQIDLCLEKKLLKAIYPLMVEGKKALESTGLASKFFDASAEKDIADLFSEAAVSLEASFEILLSENKEKNRLSMLLLHKSLEYLCQIFFQGMGEKKTVWAPNKLKARMQFEYRLFSLPAVGTAIFSSRSSDGTKAPKTHGQFVTHNLVANLIKEFFNPLDLKLLEDMDGFTTKRNLYIHPNLPSNTPKIQLKEIKKYTAAIVQLAKGIQSYT